MSHLSPRLVAIDLDGTLLNSAHRLSERDCSAVRRLAERGVRVVLASGRMHRTIVPFAQQIGLDDPIISYNGGLVIDVASGEVLFHLPVAWKIVAELIDWAAERGLHLNLYVDDELYVREQNEWSEMYDRRTGAMSQPIGDLHRLVGSDSTKVQIVTSPDRAAMLLPEVQRWSCGRVIAMHTQPEYIEIVNREVSKGRALLALAEQLEIAPEQTVAFGDGSNDRSMLEVSDFSVVMENASDTIKAYADHITASNDEAGVAQAIERFLL